jgi:molybdopterin-guanine dinucleotide biosynthesis protein A
MLMGLLLCGGQSRRMGHDKGLLTYKGSYWASEMLERLQNVLSDVKVSVNPGQISIYSGFLPKSLLIADTLRPMGPLNGLLSAHLQYPQYDFFVLACDMIDLREDTMRRLMHRYYEDRGAYDVYLFEVGGGLEPLCAIYTREWLSAVYTVYKEGGLADYSLKSYFAIRRSPGVQRYTINTPDQEKEFANYNFPGKGLTEHK